MPGWIRIQSYYIESQGPRFFMMIKLTILVGVMILNFAVLSDAKRKPKKGCLGKNGKWYMPNKGYDIGCYTYTCLKHRKKYTMVGKFSSKNCCVNKAGAIFNIGHIMYSQDLGPCSKKIAKCVKNDAGSASIEIEFHHGDCCSYNGNKVPIGDSFPLPAQCARVNCTMQGQVPTITVEVEHESCHCCLDNDGNLHVDGSNITLKDGTTVNCCNGKWVTVVNIEQCSWTPWQDRDNPGGYCDCENAPMECQGKTGGYIQQFEIQKKAGGPIYNSKTTAESGLSVILTLRLRNFAIDNGVHCFNNAHQSSQKCEDYIARYCCVTSGPVDQWTPWTP